MARRLPFHKGPRTECRLTQATNSRTCCCNCVEKGPHIRLADHIPRSSTAGGEGRAAGAGAGIKSGTFDPNRLSSGSMFFPYLHTSASRNAECPSRDSGRSLRARSHWSRIARSIVETAARFPTVSAQKEQRLRLPKVSSGFVVGSHGASAIDRCDISCSLAAIHSRTG
jgi:hypothetical protein